MQARMHARNSWKLGILKEDYQEAFKNLTWFFPLHPVPFYGHYYKIWKEPATSYQALFGLQNMFRKNSFLVIYHTGNFGDSLPYVHYEVVSDLLQILHFLIYESQFTTS